MVSFRASSTAIALTLLLGIQPILPSKSALADSTSAIPDEAEMNHLGDISDRIQSWFILLQNGIAEEQQQELISPEYWTGKEYVPEKPLIYNPQIIHSEYGAALAALPDTIRNVILGSDALPKVLPNGINFEQFAAMIRPVYLYAEQGPRWTYKYSFIGQDPAQEYVDMRPWLELRKHRKKIVAEALLWPSLDQKAKLHWFDEVTASCVLGQSSGTIEDCRELHSSLIKQNSESESAVKFLKSVYQKGVAENAGLLQIDTAHVNTVFDKSFEDSNPVLTVGLAGVPTEKQSWFKTQIESGWSFEGQLKIKVHFVAVGTPRSVFVEFNDIALDHVSGQPADHIVVGDHNDERSARILVHEFGHILGFYDCYVEFYNPAQGQFIYYTLDSANRMCSTFGGTLPSHRDAILAAYFKQN